MTGEEKENIKYRLSDIGKQVGELALEHISDLEKENAELKAQVKSFENDFDYQNKIIDKYKQDLKKLRVAYIQAQVANVINGTDFETIFKNIFTGAK